MEEDQVGSTRRSRRMRITAGDTDDRGWTPLHIVARKGDLKQVRRLLNEGMDANVMAGGPKSFGMTPLHLAAKGGHVRVMDELLERGADIDARAKGACAWTPLHHAAKEKKKKAIKFLIRNGAFLPDDISDPRFNPPNRSKKLLISFDISVISREMEQKQGKINNNLEDGVVIIHSQVRKIRQEMEKIKYPALTQPEITGKQQQQRSRSPLGLAHRPISVGS